MPATACPPDCMALCVPAEQNETFADTLDLLNEDEEGLSDTESLSLLSQQHRKDAILSTISESSFEPELPSPVKCLLPPIPEAEGWSDNEMENQEKSPGDDEEEDFNEESHPHRFLREDEDFVTPAYARTVHDEYNGHELNQSTARLFHDLMRITSHDHTTLNGTDSHQYLFQHFDADNLEYEAAVAVRPKFIGQYLMGDCLGEGSYAKVKEALNTETLERAAVKIFSPVKLKRIPNGMQNVLKEVNILQKLNHPNVCRMKELLKKELKKKLYLIMEYAVCAISDLTKTLPQERLPAWKAHYYFVQLLDGLQYCHSRGVVHKDLKPSNLVITTQDTLKIIDFGVAEQLSPYSATDLVSSSQGCPAVQPPEVADGVELFSGFKLDVWSCGVTFFSLCAGNSRFPFVGETVYELFANISERPHEMPADVRNTEPEFCALIDAMLEKKEANRPSLDELRHHPWVRRHWPMPPAGFPIQDYILQAETRSVDSFLPYIHAHLQLSLTSNVTSRAQSICCATGGRMPHHHHHYPRCHSHHLTHQSSTRRSCHKMHGSRRLSTDSRHLVHNRSIHGSMNRGIDSREKGAQVANTTVAVAQAVSPATDQGCFSFKKWKICRVS